MECTKNIGNLTKKDILIAGGKGASLGEMTQAGINVPVGFVVLTTCFDNFLKNNNISPQIQAALDTIDIKAVHTIENASEKIASIIENASIPSFITEAINKEFKKLNVEFVAVRSSATAEDSGTTAWAGQLSTFLNTPKKNLIKNIKLCWSSLFSPRALYYRKTNKLDSAPISVAVIIQEMVRADKSGIAFSVHPITQDYNQLIIEAGYGLGEAIVSGQITPDSYIIQKDSYIIFDKYVSEQKKLLSCGTNGGTIWMNVEDTKVSLQKLSDKEIIQLSKIVVSIEKHYGFPCDIEWVLKNNQFVILQSRPITTLNKKHD